MSPMDTIIYNGSFLIDKEIKKLTNLNYNELFHNYYWNLKNYDTTPNSNNINVIYDIIKKYLYNCIVNQSNICDSREDVEKTKLEITEEIKMDDNIENIIKKLINIYSVDELEKFISDVMIK